MEISLEELKKLEHQFLTSYNQIKAKSLSLDMTRGKPGTEQLDLSKELVEVIKGEFTTDSGVDVRNYGGLDGIPEAKKLFSTMIQVEESEIIIGGNSSLSLMYQFIDNAFHHGVSGKESAWSAIPSGATFLCPVPGYDRHFSICEFLGIKMIPIPLNEDGPDLQSIKDILSKDPSVCGMWCVPKYSNPTGVVYSSEVIKELTELVKIARPEFRVMWDNAYSLHDLTEVPRTIPSVLSLAKQAGTEDKFIIFGSTSKITFAGSGVSCMGASKANLSSFLHYLSFQTIGPDKVNQLRHVKFFKSIDTLRSHMQGHREILAPKFKAVQDSLESKLGSYGFAKWTKPEGGYFISVDTLPGLANEVVAQCQELGVKITPAGATYPYKVDPDNSNIRIAPSFPTLEQIRLAMDAFTTTVGLTSVRKLLKK